MRNQNNWKEIKKTKRKNFYEWFGRKEKTTLICKVLNKLNYLQPATYDLRLVICYVDKHYTLFVFYLCANIRKIYLIALLSKIIVNKKLKHWLSIN